MGALLDGEEEIGSTHAILGRNLDEQLELAVKPVEAEHAGGLGEGATALDDAVGIPLRDGVAEVVEPLAQQGDEQGQQTVDLCGAAESMGQRSETALVEKVEVGRIAHGSGHGR